MQVSVVIPTYYRRKDVDRCLDSIVVQTTLPKEVIVVDDSENDEVKNLIEQKKEKFKQKGIDLRYIRNKRERGLTIARNIGVENATGDVILFLDSDVILDKEYIREILKVYKEKPNTLGVQGLICTDRKAKRKLSKFIEAFNKVFYIQLDEKNKFRLLPSLGVSFPSVVDEIINCEWLSGANQSYRREILKEFRWDENLKRYSQGEDLDLPYRIFKKYPDSLFMTPHAKLVHNEAEEGRPQKRELIYMDIIYLTYLFYKNIDQNLKNKLIYIWSWIGRTMFGIVSSILNPSKKFLEAKYQIEALFYCMKHMREIKEGNLEFFNRTLRG
jgi:glycosyltransferase involved in cell wall biosynthesis